MATSQIKLPPGFELEGASTLPPGFELETPEKTSWKEDVKIGAVGALSTLQKADAGLRGALASAFGNTDEADRIFQERAARGKKQDQWANPNQKEQSFGGKVVGTLATLPLQVAAMPFSPFDTGQTMVDNGESLGKAQLGGAIDTVGNMAGVAMPGAVGTKVMSKALSGGAINAAQDTAVRLAIQGIADKEATKKAFAPSLESAALSGIVGAGMGAVSPSTSKPKPAPRPKVDVDSVVTATPEVVKTPTDPLQLDLLSPDNQGTTANQFQASLGEWRTDENGIPIRADLSMDAQNAQQPLQMGLWGDELPPMRDPVGPHATLAEGAAQAAQTEGGQGGIPLTQAMDSMYPAARTAAIAQEFPPTDVEASGQLQGAKADADNTSGWRNQGFGRSQRGGIDFQAITESISRLRNAFGSKPDSVQHPITPETIAKKQETVSKLKALKEVLPEWAKTVGSFEEAVAEGANATDIKTTTVGTNVASGLNFMAAYHKNPILNYARSLFMDARGEASSASRKYITSKENGIGTLITKMDTAEKTVLAELIHSLDKHQKDYTPEMGEKLGLSDTGKKFMETMGNIAKFDFEWKKKILDGMGKNTPRERKGYAPSVFSGSYVSKVMDGEGNIIGIIAADTPGEFIKAKEHYSTANPGAKFSADTWQKARKSISGNQNRGFILRDTMAIFNLLSQVDGDIAKAHVSIEQAIRKGSNELWGMDVHEKMKKGVVGNQGNKPWLSKEKNAQQRLDSLVRYYEEAFEYYSLQKPIEELNLLQKTDQLSHLPNTFNYLDQYLENVLGRRLSGPGAAFNWVFDNGHKLLENVAAKVPVAKDIVGPGNTLKGANIVKNKMSHLYMGLGNYMFTISQWLQPLQTGLPYMELVANRIGVDPMAVHKGLVVGGQDFYKLRMGKDLDPNIKTAALYGESRGIFDFTELERAYEGHKSKLGRAWDNAAEWNMQLGESLTRPPMFLGFVRILLDAGYDIKDVLPAAENLTNQSMVDYHPYERPLMYGGMGVLGQHAGGLTTFKHNYIGTQVLLGKEASRSGMRSKAPLALSGLAMMALAGVTGLPGYQEADWLYQEMREGLTKERRSIAQDIMANAPQWVKSGVLSDQLGLNMQGKFSAADMVPDTPGKALFPHLSGAVDIGSAALEAAKNPNATTGANLAMAATPSGFKRVTEGLVRRDADNNVLNKKGQVEVNRSERDWDKSMLSGSLVPNQEAAKKAELWQDKVNELAKKDRMKVLADKFEQAVINGDNEAMLEVLNSYEKLTGVPPTKLINRIPQIQQEAQMDAQERAQGIPRSLEGIKRYEAYN